jgi:YfiR/HmsC-like
VFLLHAKGHRPHRMIARWYVRVLGVWTTCGLIVAQPARIHAQISATDEYREKAVFLSNFPSFVEWPVEAFSSPQAPLFVCVYGAYSFGISLAENAGAKTAHGRRMEVRRAKKESELRNCHILFVSHSEGKHYAAVMQAIQGASVLTVGETPDFLAAGGAVSFLYQGDTLQFEVNLNNANEAHLKLSASMLSLARRVVNKTTEARS